MKIRKANSMDSEQAYKLLNSEKKKSFTVSDFKSSTKHKDAIYFVAENERKIIGYVIGFISPTKKTDCMLAETRVLETKRGRHVGSLLVDAFCKEAFSRGAKNVYAEIERKHLNFYCKNKFRKNGKWFEVVRSR